MGLFLGFYALVNTFIYVRLLHLLSLRNSLFFVVSAVLLFMICAYPLGRISERIGRGFLSDEITWIGSFWLGAMTYLFLIFAFLEIVKLILTQWLNLGPFYQSIPVTFFRLLGAAILLIVAILLGYGYRIAKYPRMTTVHVPLKKLKSSCNPLKIIQLSDIHLGTMINQKRLEEIVQAVNARRPDLVVITGDLIDENVAKAASLMGPLSKMKSRCGIYAVTGNHEFYAGAHRAVQFMKQAGIRVLRNETVTIENILNIIGVDDLEAGRFEGKPAGDYHDLMRAANPALPTVLLNHRPQQLKAAAQAGIALQLSGHTHHGQLFPFNYVTDLVYDISSGFGRVGEMFVYVSNGVGTWGPPVRIGAPPEIAEIILEAVEKKERDL